MEGIFSSLSSSCSLSSTSFRFKGFKNNWFYLCWDFTLSCFPEFYSSSG